MRIAETPKGIEIIAEDGDSTELLAIAQKHMPDWLALFAKKNADYGGGSAFELGERGQYSDIHRKMIKLKRSMWDGEELGFEGQAEVISDLIGHLFLTLHMMQLKEEAQRSYAFNEDRAAVDSFMRMMGHDADKALAMSYNLTPPFGELVREFLVRSGQAKIDVQACVEFARIPTVMEASTLDQLRIEHAQKVVVGLDAAQERLQKAGLLAPDGTPRLLSRAQLMNMAEGAERDGRTDDLGAIKARIVESFQSEEFGAADQAQHVPIQVGDVIASYPARPRRDDDPVHPQS